MKIHKSDRAVSRAARKSGMHRTTASKYLKAGMGPKEMRRRRPKRVHRTRCDPLAGIWPDAVRMLQDYPSFEAKWLFEKLLAQHPDQAAVAGKAMRTFQRRVAEWKRHHGPERVAHIPQEHAPGQVMQFDWTEANDLKVTLSGVPFPHKLARAMLPYSNCEWAIPCHSESTLSLKAGLQAAYWEFGGVTPITQTDQSSTATHQLQRDSKQRGFNREYLALCQYVGTEPRTIHVRSPNENGDVESGQWHIKRQLNQHLMFRASRDFKDEADYAAFVAKICRGLNVQATRAARFKEEAAHFRPLPRQRFPEYEERAVRASSFSTVRIKNCAYSVPTRLIGVWLQAQVTETEVSIFDGAKLVVRHPRSHGQEPRIDYRHVVASLVKKPGGFARCKYREQLFPTLVFRQAHQSLHLFDEPNADRYYVQLLALAAAEGEGLVDEAIAACLRTNEPPLPPAVRTRLGKAPEPVTALQPFTPELGSYDRLAKEVSA